MNRRTQLMFGMFTKATTAPHDYLKFAMSPTDVNTWYILIENVKGEEDEFEGGQYLVRMKAPPNFPFSPPEFYFMTPNGLYDVEKKVCISIGEFHKESYQATLGMLGFAEQLVSGMTDVKFLGHGISILHLTAADRKKFANESVNYNNIYNRQYMDLITESFAGYSTKWTAKAANASATNTTGTTTVDNLAASVANVNIASDPALAAATESATATAVAKPKKKASSMKFLLE
ncbi:ubiquitin-conjugating enzyme E2 [Faustovirus]|nr:ubiquitin-conjugating enzyme E2 [Faustovirus]QJX72841.1 ubiquitin-conjugating enzyme E2 [Faustovirus]QJX73347.1 ubiquitin-conjugating enzyme E2 [Faustovirus]